MGRIGPDQLGRIFDEHAAALVLFARQWCDAPEDVVQDAFVALAQQRASPDQIISWLYRVVRNGAITAARRSNRRRRREGRAAQAELVSDEPWFSATDDRIDAESASRLLALLDVEIREVIVSRLWGGLTFEEIAELQGCSAKARSTHCHIACNRGIATLCLDSRRALPETLTRMTEFPCPTIQPRASRSITVARATPRSFRVSQPGCSLCGSPIGSRSGTDGITRPKDIVYRR